ncbi:ribonuclease H-like domain-containing protein [Candidatus Berkelbacteria bacterium]|nr:ribonuclease H-like domain-containing protein [Candidatus Berkelbacteria bacterium]
MKAVIDIETLPAPKETEPLLRELYERRPGRATSFDEYWRGTSFSGNFGRLYCIGLALGDDAASVLQGEEPAMLTQFWQMVAKASLFIGHNILEFDLPFIYKRSIIHGIKPSHQLSFARYRSSPIFDTMREWDNWSTPSTSLDQLAKILGLASSKQGMDGSLVYAAYLKGQHQAVYDYCARDVELTRQIYQRLTFQSKT